MTEMTILRRNMEAGETVSVDNGRVVITMEEKSGRKARLKIQIDPGLHLDKPSLSAGGIYFKKPIANAKAIG